MPISRKNVLVAAVAVLGLAGCDNDDGGVGGGGGARACTDDIFLVTDDFRLLVIRANAPGTVVSATPLTGVPVGTQGLAIDVNPNTGVLTALDHDGNVYTVSSGTLTPVNTTPNALPPDASLIFDIDFNPLLQAPDRFRAVYDSAHNLRFRVDTGALAGTDSELFYADGSVAPAVTGVAYSNSGRNNGTPPNATTVFVIDSANDTLSRLGAANATTASTGVDSPNGGQLTKIGPLGVDLVRAPLDIGCSPEVAFTVGQRPGQSNPTLYTVNLSTGAATRVGDIPVTRPILALAVEK